MPFEAVYFIMAQKLRVEVTPCGGNWPVEVGFIDRDCVSDKPLWAAEVGLLAAGQDAGTGICDTGFYLRLKTYPLH